MTPAEFKIWFTGYREGHAKQPHVQRIGEMVDQTDFGPVIAKNPIKNLAPRLVPDNGHMTETRRISNEDAE